MHVRSSVRSADELNAIQVEVLCWCGLPGRFNSRIHADEVVRAGDTAPGDEVRHQVLCRKHRRPRPSSADPGQLRLA